LAGAQTRSAIFANFIFPIDPSPDSPCIADALTSANTNLVGMERGLGVEGANWAWWNGVQLGLGLLRDELGRAPVREEIGQAPVRDEIGQAPARVKLRN